MAIQKYTNYYEWISSENNDYAGGPFSSYDYRNLNINDFKTELENLFFNQTVYFNTIQFGFYYKSAVTNGDYDFRIDSTSIETKTSVGSTIDKYFDTNYTSKCSAIGIPTSSIQLGVKSSAYQVHYSKFKIKWYPKFPVYITSSDGVIYADNYDMGTVLPFSAANRLGYTFSKWTDNDTNLSRTITVNGQITLAAEYTPNIYTITLNNQSATTTGTSTLYLKYNTGWYSDSATTTSISSITIPTKTGYTFGGYYTSTNGAGSQIIDSNGNINSGCLTFTTTNNISLYAKWIPITYYVSYNNNGGSGSINTQDFVYDTAESLTSIGNSIIGPVIKLTYDYNDYITSNSEDESNKVFSYWYDNEDKNNSNKWYSDGQEVINLRSTNGATVPLQAQWGDAFFTLEAPSRKYHQFLNWTDGTNIYNAGDTASFSTNTTLTAQWKKNQYRAFSGVDNIEKMYLSKNKKIEKIFVGTTEV